MGGTLGEELSTSVGSCIHLLFTVPSLGLGKTARRAALNPRAKRVLLRFS